MYLSRKKKKQEWAKYIQNHICIFQKWGILHTLKEMKTTDSTTGDTASLLHRLVQLFKVKEQSQFGFTCIVL